MQHKGERRIHTDDPESCWCRLPNCPCREQQWPDEESRPAIIGIVLDDIIVERIRHKRLYPDQTRSPAEWLAVLTGELGEVADEVLKMTVFDQANHDKYWEEMVHVAAVAIAALESMYFRRQAHEERVARRNESGSA